MQVLVLVWVPSPQKTEHSDHSPKSVYPPLARFERYYCYAVILESKTHERRVTESLESRLVLSLKAFCKFEPDLKKILEQVFMILKIR